MNTSTINSGVGLARFAPPAEQAPSRDLYDIDQATEYLARVRSVATLTDRLQEIPPEIHPQVIERVAARQPQLVRGYLAAGHGDAHLLPVTALENLFTDVDDATVDTALESRSWILAEDTMRKVIVDRLRRASESPIAAGLHKALWQGHAARMAAHADPDLLVALHRDGHVSLGAALEAMAEAGHALRQVLPETPSPGDARYFCWYLLGRRHSVHDDDIAGLVEHAAFLRHDGNIICRAQLTTGQRVTLLSAHHPVLARFVTDAWAQPGAPRPTSEEVQQARMAATREDGHLLMAEVLMRPKALRAVGEAWVDEWITQTGEIDQLAYVLIDQRNAGPVRQATAIGARLTGSVLAVWLAHAGPRTQRCVAAQLGAAGLAANLDAFLAHPRLCVELPYLPAAIGTAVANSDHPPAWVANLVRGVLGTRPLIFEAAQQLIDEGFKGSFIDLRRELFGAEHPSDRYTTAPWFTALRRTLADNMDC